MGVYNAAHGQNRTLQEESSVPLITQAKAHTPFVHALPHSECISQYTCHMHQYLSLLTFCKVDQRSQTED